MSDSIEVTQADREWAMRPELSVGYTQATRAKVLRGEKDDDPIVQSVAAHRLATEQASDKLTADEVTEAAALVKGDARAILMVMAGRFLRGEHRRK